METIAPDGGAVAGDHEALCDQRHAPAKQSMARQIREMNCFIAAEKRNQKFRARIPGTPNPMDAAGVRSCVTNSRAATSRGS
jgi:hypothetical protein